MATLPTEHVLALAGVLFAMGAAGVMIRRNMIFLLLSLEIMLNAAGLAFVAAGARWAEPDGQVMFFFVLSAAAAEVAVGLALVLLLQARTNTIDVDSAGRMKE